MPRNVTVTFEDGTSHTYENAPDDATPQQVSERAQREFSKRVTGLDGGRQPQRQAPRQTAPQATTPRAPTPQAAPPTIMEEPGTIVDVNQQAMDNAALPASDPNAVQFSDEWLAEQEAAYQASIGGNPPPPPAPPSAAAMPPEAERGFFDTPSWDQAKQDLAIGAGGITEAAGDIVGLVGNPLNATINGLFDTELSTDLGGSLRNSIFGEQRGNRYVEAINQGVAGGLMTAGAANLAGNAAGNVAQRGLYELGNMPIRDAVSGATGAVSSTLAADAGAGAAGQLAAGLVGGVGGFAASGLPRAASAGARAERFATREAKQNPYAAFDAEIAADVAGLTRNRAVSPTDPTGRAAVTATQINSLERSYTTRFNDMITEADMTPQRRLQLRTALDRTQSMPMDEINALRGDVIGDAVADGLTKRQRLRQLTPELKAGSSLITKATNLSDLVPFNPIPAVVTRGVRAIARASGDGEAARVNAAQKLISKERGYKRLGEITGPSGANESSAALREAYGQSISRRQAEAALKKATKPRAEDPIDRMAAAGTQGSFGALDSFARTAGLDRATTARIIASLTGNNPELARDATRVLAGHGTVKARMGPTFNPLIRAEAERLGIMPSAKPTAASAPVAPAMAQRELELTAELEQINPTQGTFADGTSTRSAPEDLPPELAARQTEIEAELGQIRAAAADPIMNAVARPHQWEQGRNRYQTQANESNARMMTDPGISPHSIEVLGNAPSQLRDNFKTTAEAEQHIAERILPDLESAGISAAEIQRVRTYLFEIAQAKPYADRASLEAGTRYRGPGRPPNEEQ